MIDINKALGMSERPLQDRDEVAELREQLAHAERRAGTVSPRGVDRGFACGRHYLQVAGVTIAVEGDPCRDSSIGGLWDKEKIEAVCDRARAIESESNTTIHGLIAERNMLSEQLAEVARERDEAKTCLEKFMGLIETDGKYGLLCDGTYPYATVTEAMQAAHNINCEQLGKHQSAEYTFRQKCHELERQLATVQAEAAAMFRLVEKYAMELREEHDPEHFQTESQRSISYELDLVRKVLDGTAGRELLDEMRRKDGRIADLERQLAEQKRDADLCRELRVLMPKSGYRMSMTIGSVRIECLEPQKLFDLLISIRDGGAK